MKSIELKDLFAIEDNLGLYDYKIGDIPLWHIYRYKFRHKWMDNKKETLSISNKNNFKQRITITLSIFFRSLFDVLKLLNNKSYDNVFLGNPRLDNINGVFVDRFTDPIIERDEIGELSCILQFSMHKNYSGKRFHQDISYSVEMLYILCRIVAYMNYLFFMNKTECDAIDGLYKRACGEFYLNESDRKSMHFQYVRFKWYARLWSSLFKKLNAKRVFFSMRCAYLPHIYAAHKQGIPIYEFQHGVTFSDTILYGGRYDYIFSPDNFLAFGSIWNGNQFGIEPDRIINIGWAFKDFIIEKIKEEIKENTVLVISSPTITDSILEHVIKLADANLDWQFEIRCHPLEKYNERQQDLVNSRKNISLANNTINSYIALGQYRYILGENSTVLYEALSLGKIVGRFNYDGLHAHRTPNVDNDGFFYLNSINDFKNLISIYISKNKQNAYSDFDIHKFIQLPIKQY